MRTSGTPAAPLMVVIAEPHEDDLEAGSLLSMASSDGRMFRRIMRQHSVQDYEVYVVAVGRGGGDARSLGEQVEELRDVFREACAKVLVPLGGEALRACAGLWPITDWRGYLVSAAECANFKSKLPTQVEYKTSKKCPCVKLLYPGPIGCDKCKQTGYLYRKGDTRTVMKAAYVEPLAPLLPNLEWIIPCLSPLDVRKSGLTMLPVFSADLNRAYRALNGQLNRIPQFYTDSMPFAGGDVVAVDIETWTDGSINRVGLEAGGMTYSSSLSMTVVPALETARMVIAHNAAFDFPRIQAQLGVNMDTKFPWDTMLAAYMLHPDGKKGLNWVISRYLDVPRHKHLAGSEPALYNALDVKYTWALYAKMKHELSYTGQLNFFENGMMAALPTLIDMTVRGIKVDTKYAENHRPKLIEQRERLLLEQAKVNLDYSMQSPISIAHHFKLRSSDKEALLRLRAKSDPDIQMQVDRILEYRDVTKALGTYFRNTPSRLHPSYLPGARDDDTGNKGIAYSGRPTASNPNIQNQPKYARRLFIADEGMMLASLDWSQIEPRITAALSLDEVLAADLEGDVYAAVAQTASCSRPVAKTVFLLSAYLGSPKTLQDKLMVAGVAMEYREAKALQDALFRRYHKWHKWREQVLKRAADYRELHNVFGKWAPFLQVHPAKAANFHPQSCAACILWYTLPKVRAAIAPLGGQIVTTVHDEIMIQAPAHLISAAARAARTQMMAVWPEIRNDFYVPVKTKVGTNWADMHAEDSLWAMFDGAVPEEVEDGEAA